MLRAKGMKHAADRAEPRHEQRPASDRAGQLQAIIGNQAILRSLRRDGDVVQRDGDAPAPAAATVHALARGATRGRGHGLPHLERIQQAFGHHDIRGVQAHTGDHAAQAARGMRARAFTLGEHVAFADRPDLHTAAHEAAHVVQQRRGVTARDGVGERGDRYERHAELVAELVVGGRSAESTLGPPIGAGADARAVQRAESEQELIDAGKALRAPDTLNADTTLTITGELTATSAGKAFTDSDGTRELTSGTRLRIMSEADGKTVIRIFEWNDKARGYDQFEGTIPTAAVTLGSTTQNLVDDGAIVPEDVGDVHQEDVLQVGLSDCYFQAALVALAAVRPQAIIDMVTETVDGVQVRLYDGPSYAPVAHLITVKRALFADTALKPIYHGKAGAWLWPAFISKAWAVFKGGFAAIQMGLAGDAMFALTGRPSSSVGIDPLATSVLGVKAPALGFGPYDRIRDNLDADKPVALGTGSFAKGWFKALNNAAKPKGHWDSRSLPAGEVRNLHGYAVLDIQPRALKESDFSSSFPDVTVTLRDPRDAEGGVFTRTLKDILTAGKFTTFHYEQ